MLLKPQAVVRQMVDYGADAKEWKKVWAKTRAEFLDGRILDAIILPAPNDDGVRWECPICGEHGKASRSEKQAAATGRKHMQTHITAADRLALEDLKVTKMPTQLLTPYQHHRRVLLEQKQEKQPRKINP